MMTQQSGDGSPEMTGLGDRHRSAAQRPMAVRKRCVTVADIQLIHEIETARIETMG
jgi:hypothetical protein